MFPFPSFAKTRSDNIYLDTRRDGWVKCCVPHADADADYSELRPNIGLKPDQLLKLDNFWIASVSQTMPPMVMKAKRSASFMRVQPPTENAHILMDRRY